MVCELISLHCCVLSLKCLHPLWEAPAFLLLSLMGRLLDVAHGLIQSLREISAGLNGLERQIQLSLHCIYRRGEGGVEGVGEV